MKNFLMLAFSALLLTSCNNTPTPAKPEATKPETSTPVPATEAAPQWVNLSGAWNLEVFARAQETAMETPNLQGTLTLQQTGDKVTGEYVATVRADEFRTNSNDRRRITYRLDSGFWTARKQWDSSKAQWVGNEQLSFKLRPIRLEKDGVATDEDYPVNLLCNLYSKSRVEKPTSGKETYVLTCNTETKNLKLDGYLERLK